MWNPRTCDCECNKAYKIDNLIIKNRSCEKYSFGKLILAGEDEIQNATTTSLLDKKEPCEKSNYLIHTISLVIMSLLLLVVISISFIAIVQDIGQKRNTHHI